MTVRPPTLREKRRYVLVRVDPAGTAVDPKELYFAVSDAITSLWGDAMAALILQAVIAVESGHAVIRCRRGSERELAIALSTVTAVRETRVALRIVAASGTIESLRERFRPAGPAAPAGDAGAAPPAPGRIVRFAGKEWEAVSWDGQKVDVIEKGFKNAHRLFLTQEDLEDSHAATIPDGI